MQGERIVLLGAGRVATQLARALSLWPSEGQRIQLYSPGGHSARRLAAKLTCEVSVARSLSELDKDADCYIFAVPDTVMPRWRANWQSSISGHRIVPSGYTSRGQRLWRIWRSIIVSPPSSILCRPSPRSGSRTSVRYRFIWRGIRPWRVEQSKPWRTD